MRSRPPLHFVGGLRSEGWQSQRCTDEENHSPFSLHYKIIQQFENRRRSREKRWRCVFCVISDVWLRDWIGNRYWMAERWPKGRNGRKLAAGRKIFRSVVRPVAGRIARDSLVQNPWSRVTTSSIRLLLRFIWIGWDLRLLIYFILFIPKGYGGW